MSDRGLSPWSADAERAVIGGAIVSGSLLADLCRMVQASDFRSPAHQAIFAAIEARWRAGDPIDATVIAGDCAQVTDVAQVLAGCIAQHGSSASTLTHARAVGDLAAVRRIEAIASQTLSRIHDDHVHDPGLLLDGLRADVADVHLPNDPRPVEGLWVGADLLAHDFPEPPWVVPGLLRAGWRLLFVGVEGGGKSTMLRQITVGAATGEHPFGAGPIDAVPALIVDVENPASVIRDGLRRMSRHVETADLTVLSRPGGIDIRQRRDRDLLHRVFAQVQPKVCAIGPLYKLYRTDRGESDEQAAIAAQNVLDELRVAHDCALILETHAPKGGTAFRELIPFGSSAWMRWPELGWKLTPCDERGNADADGRSVKIGHFRGDRVEVDVPARFDRGAGSWPWQAYWPQGIPRGFAA